MSYSLNDSYEFNTERMLSFIWEELDKIINEPNDWGVDGNILQRKVIFIKWIRGFVYPGIGLASARDLADLFTDKHEIKYTEVRVLRKHP